MDWDAAPYARSDIEYSARSYYLAPSRGGNIRWPLWIRFSLGEKCASDNSAGDGRHSSVSSVERRSIRSTWKRGFFAQSRLEDSQCLGKKICQLNPEELDLTKKQLQTFRSVQNVLSHFYIAHDEIETACYFSLHDFLEFFILIISVVIILIIFNVLL